MANALTRVARAAIGGPITLRNIAGAVLRSPVTKVLPGGAAIGTIAGAVASRPRITPPIGGIPVNRLTAPPRPPAPPQLPGSSIQKTPGVRGAIQRTLPGGKTGYQIQAGPAPKKAAGFGNAVARVLPGGRSGYVHEALQDAGFAAIVSPELVQRVSCPPGYVAVTLPDGSKACMYKPMARSLGLWKARPKPPVSGWDQKAIRRAASAQKRVKKLAGSVGFTVTKKGSSRRPSCPPKKR